MAKILKGDFGKSAPAKKDANAADKPIPCYQLKLAIPFSDPLIWRSIQVPGRMTLAEMHRTIQACMGWEDSDSHQFLVGKIFYQPGFGIEDFKRKPEYDEAAFQLHQLEEGMQFLFSYLYDGGDGWELQIAVEEILPPGAVGPSPLLIDGATGCPPEEVGDIHQYQTLLSALDESAADPGSFSLDIGDTIGYRPYVCNHEDIRRRLEQISIR